MYGPRAETALRCAAIHPQERRVWFPARKVSSLTFTGPDLADIYVTTAGGQNKAAEGPGAGDLFRLNQGIRGRSEFLSCVGL